MLKKRFLLSLGALVLSACSSNTPAPVVNAGDSELPPGVMLPVPGTGAMDQSYGWQTDIQSTTMPSSMNTPVYTPQPLPSVSPQIVPTPQPSVPSVPRPVDTAPVTPAVKPTKAGSQTFNIPRDENNAPIYSQIDKGFYQGDTYTVRKGDTMFLIAYIAGKDVREIAELNNLSEPYQLHVGKVLKLGNSSNVSAPTATANVEVKESSEVSYTQAPNGTAFGSDGTVTGPVKAGTASNPPQVVKAQVGSVSKERVAGTSSTSAPVRSGLKWFWPTEGRVISGFSTSEGGNKGLDIAGTRGQAVKAAAGGKVVYAGNAIKGYGNIIIIKHNDDFMSAYAHNDTMKVEEQDDVKAGQTIATLGSTGTNSPKLHFEIRYQGKTVDPALYLPKR